MVAKGMTKALISSPQG